MPETSLPPPPKHHGGGAFIGAAIVMLLAMGGLLYWKFGKSDPPPAPPPAPSVAKAPTFEEAPPPPPPIEPDAGKKAAPTRKRVGSVGAGPCGASCKGEAPSALRAALGGTAGSARGCYERALRQNSTLQGKLMVAVKVGPAGNTCSASLASDTLGDPSIAACVLQKFRGGSFPAPIGGCVDVQVPISFMPKTAGK